MTIYIDEVLVLNFIIDFLILITLSITLKHKTKVRYIILSSLIGSLSILVLFIKFNNICLFLYKLIISFLMVIMAFGFKNIIYTIKNIIYFLFISIIYGGFLYFVINNTSFKINGLTFIKSNTDINIMFLVIVSPLILYLYIKMMHKRYNLDLKVKVDIIIDNIKVSLNGFIDTGNSLKEPYSGKDVMISSNKYIKKYIDKNKFIFVPYESIKGNGLLKVSKFKKVFINNSLYEDVLIGYTEEKIKIDDVEILLNKNMIGDIYD